MCELWQKVFLLEMNVLAWSLVVLIPVALCLMVIMLIKILKEAK